MDPLDLLTGADHADPYTWSAALLAHALLGLVLTGMAAALIEWADEDEIVIDHGHVAAASVVIGYLLLWELAVQHLGEGLSGSLSDTVGVASGAVIGLMAWQRAGARLALAVLALSAMLVFGVWVRA